MLTVQSVHIKQQAFSIVHNEFCLDRKKFYGNQLVTRASFSR